jgi:ribose 1,5-bisphosphokinase PhnN
LERRERKPSIPHGNSLLDNGRENRGSLHKALTREHRKKIKIHECICIAISPKSSKKGRG